MCKTRFSTWYHPFLTCWQCKSRIIEEKCFHGLIILACTRGNDDMRLPEVFKRVYFPCKNYFETLPRINLRRVLGKYFTQIWVLLASMIISNVWNLPEICVKVIFDSTFSTLKRGDECDVKKVSSCISIYFMAECCLSCEI